MSRPTVRVKCCYMYDTEKAFRAEFHDPDGDLLGNAWLPKSQVKQVVAGDTGFVVCGERGEEILVDMPQWLAEKDEIAPLIREQLLEQEDGERDGEDDDIPF